MSSPEVGIGHSGETEESLGTPLGLGKGRRKTWKKLAWILGGFAVASIAGLWAVKELGTLPSSI